MIKTIFLDIDGVLADFRKGVHDAFNKPYFYSTLTSKWYFWDDWPDVSSKMVDAICTMEFWIELSWMYDGQDILREVTKYFKPEQVYLLTTPMSNVESPTGKWIWVKNNIPKYYKRTIIAQAPKSLLAKPDCLLIDDKDENVEKFIAAGGDAILVPRPWNKLHKDKDCAWFTVATELVKRMDGCKLIK